MNIEDKLFDGKAKLEMKRQWIRRQMKISQDTYTDPSRHTIFCGTWNVNGRAKLDDEGLTDWLFPNQSGPHDIYAIGFQEIVELTPVNVATDMKGPQRTQFWIENINACFKKNSPHESFVCIGVKNLVGILLCIYVRQSLYSAISDVRWSTTAVGVMGVMGNKGAVVTRFNLHSTAICVVCAHLAASRDNVQGRNSDYRNIMERTLLEPSPLDSFPVEGGTAGQASSDCMVMLQQTTGGNTLSEKLLGILNHDIVFWIGDFNYRIDLSLSLDDIMSLLKHDNIVGLRKKDQLNIERKLGNVFSGFEEGLLTFPPTYKFQPGTDVYETRPEKKLRPPAWCDRILWREPANKGADRTVRQLSYRISRLRPSDHKPVGSSFDVEARVVDPKREKSAYLKLVRDLDRMENEEQPRVEIGPSLELVISDVYFQDRRRADLYIKNVGSAIANWRFVPKNSDVQLSEPWIHLEPHMGMVAPGEVGHVVIEIFVDYRSVDLLSSVLSIYACRDTTRPAAIAAGDMSGTSGCSDAVAVEAVDSGVVEVSIVNMTLDDVSVNSCSLAGDLSQDASGRHMDTISATGISSLAASADSVALAGDDDDDDDDDDDEAGDGFGKSSGRDEANEEPSPPPRIPVAVIPLQEFLILRIENGRDYFISVATNFCPTREDISIMQGQQTQIEALSQLSSAMHCTHSDRCDSPPPEERFSNGGRSGRTDSIGSSGTAVKASITKAALSDKWKVVKEKAFEKASAVKQKIKDSKETGGVGRPSSHYNSSSSLTTSNSSVGEDGAARTTSAPLPAATGAGGRRNSIRISRSSHNVLVTDDSAAATSSTTGLGDR